MPDSQTQTERLQAIIQGREVIASSGLQTRNSMLTIDETGQFVSKPIRFNPAGLYTGSGTNIVPLSLEHLQQTLQATENIDTVIPIGTAQMYYAGNQYRGSISFHGETELSRVVEKLWDMGVYNAVSIETFPDYSAAIETDDEILFNRSDVYGLTVTATPADPKALAVHLSVNEVEQAHGLLQRMELLMSANAAASQETVVLETADLNAVSDSTSLDEIEQQLNQVDEALGESPEVESTEALFVSRQEHGEVLQRLDRVEGLLLRTVQQNANLQSFVQKQISALVQPAETSVLNGVTGLGAGMNPIEQIVKSQKPNGAVLATVGGFGQPLSNDGVNTRKKMRNGLAGAVRRSKGGK